MINSRLSDLSSSPSREGEEGASVCVVGEEEEEGLICNRRCRDLLLRREVKKNLENLYFYKSNILHFLYSFNYKYHSEYSDLFTLFIYTIYLHYIQNK